MRELSDDRGVIAVVTALTGSAVLFFCAAIAIDMAVLYSERRQLQNGADAAAIAIAQSCVRGLDTSSAAPCNSGLAGPLAGQNALDGLADALVCGTAPGLGSCPASPASRASCPAPPAVSPPYVEVHTGTRTTDGGVVAPFFARAIPGLADYDGTRVGACARAGYGTPAAPVISVLPLVVSKCVVDLYYTDHSNSYAPMSLLDEGIPAMRPWESEIALHKASGPCSSSSSGQTAPGNFGFLTPTSGAGCEVTTTVGGSLPGKPGNSPPTVCTDAYLTARLGQVVYIPVFDTVTGSGNNAVYHISGYASFYFTGWKLVSSKDHKSILTDLLPCPAGNATCIAGVFFRGLLPTPGLISLPPSLNSSANVVQLLG
jgi:hypothetical protein